MRHRDFQPEIHRRDGLDMKVGTLCFANGQYNDIAPGRAAQHLGKARTIGIIDIDDRCAAIHQQGGKQA